MHVHLASKNESLEWEKFDEKEKQASSYDPGISESFRCYALGH